MEALMAPQNLTGLFSICLIVLIPLITGVILLKKPDHGKRILSFVFLSGSILAVLMLAYGKEIRFSLEGSFGVELLLDRFAWTFVLMNCLVFLGVTISMQKGALPLFAFPLMAMLHGTANAVFISYDLFNVFVCVELGSILAFLLIRLGKKPRQAWSAVIYLMVGNVGMILYLLGCLYAYNRSGSFSMSILPDLSGLPVYLLVTGLCIKGGVFLMGLWVPEAYGEAETAVSALLSGVIVKIGLAPLLRISLLNPTAFRIVLILAAAGSLWGMCYASVERDIKKVIAYSSVSQTGFILAVPGAGHIYALAHGLLKAWLFLCAGELKERDLHILQIRGLKKENWLPLVIASLALAGLPLLGGLGAKAIVFKGLSAWQVYPVYLAAMGSCVYASRFLFLPLLPSGKWTGVVNLRNLFFLSSILVLEFVHMKPEWSNVFKSTLMVLAGMAIYRVFLFDRYWKIPKWPEELVHIIGLSLFCILAMIGVFGS